MSEFVFDKNVSAESAIVNAAKNGCLRFVLFLSNPDGAGLPRNKPKQLSSEINRMVPAHKFIEDLKFTRDKKIVVTTPNAECASQISKITCLLGVHVSASLQKDCAISRFLLRDIPTDISLTELSEEIEGSNNVTVSEARRFTRKLDGAILPTECVLISIFGSRLPDRLKVWYSSHRISLFVDRPRQCTNCYKFDHSSQACTNSKTCIQCGASETHSHCSNPPKCSNCRGDHAANDPSCNSRRQEELFLQFKQRNHLSYPEARKAFKSNSPKESFSEVANRQESLSPLIPTITNIVNEAIGIAIKNLTAAVFSLINESNKKLFEMLAVRGSGIPAPSSVTAPSLQLPPSNKRSAPPSAPLTSQSPLSSTPEKKRSSVQQVAVPPAQTPPSSLSATKSTAMDTSPCPSQTVLSSASDTGIS